MTSPAERLREARLAAGYETGAAACQAFGWVYATYAGHENGSRNFHGRTLERYARALRVDPAWLQFGGQRSEAAPPPTPLPAFAEAAAPFVGRSETETGRVAALVAALLERATPPALYQAALAAPDFGILRGDVLALDLKPERTEDALVIVNIADFDRATAVTALARQVGDRLIYPATAPADLPAHCGDARVAVLGTIAAVLRLT